MNPDVACIIPDVLRLDLERKIVGGFFPVLFCVSAFVAPAAYVAAYQADPKVVGAVADAAERGCAAAEGWVGGIVGN